MDGRLAGFLVQFRQICFMDIVKQKINAIVQPSSLYLCFDQESLVRSRVRIGTRGVRTPLFSNSPPSVCLVCVLHRHAPFCVWMELLHNQVESLSFRSCHHDGIMLGELFIVLT